MAAEPAAPAAPVYQSHHFDSKRWEVVKPRPDDIVILTAYKSGTTWMQQIVSELIFQGKEKAGTCGDLSPWVDLRVPPTEVLEPMVENQTHRRFLKTHLPQDAFEPYMIPTGKYIYVGRDGRDAFMSLQNHHEKGNEVYYAALNGPGLVGPECPRYSELIADGGLTAWFDKWLSQGWDTLPESDGWPFWSYFKNVKTWWAHGQANPDSVLFVHFNNLLVDLPAEVKRIAAFLDLPCTDDQAMAIAKATCFDSMKANAAAAAPLNGIMWEGGADSFIFKGTNGRWKGVLTDQNLEGYQAKVESELSAECAKWIETGVLP